MGGVNSPTVGGGAQGAGAWFVAPSGDGPGPTKKQKVEEKREAEGCQIR